MSYFFVEQTRLGIRKISAVFNSMKNAASWKSRSSRPEGDITKNVFSVFDKTSSPFYVNSANVNSSAIRNDQSVAIFC